MAIILTAIAGTIIALSIVGVILALRPHRGRIGSDGYPDNIDRHKERCACTRCLGILHRNIHRLEVELGIIEPDPPKAIAGATIRTLCGEMILTAETVTADKYYPPKAGGLRPVPWFQNGGIL